jgi:small subunit ribosomal protein S8e
MRWQGKSIRKSTGGRIRPSRSPKKFEIGREAADTTIAPVRSKLISTLGGNEKVKLLRTDNACISDPVTGKTKKGKVETVVDNPANLNYIRRNIITKGAVIKTEFGEAKVTNRPGQDGIINAILIGKQ